MGKRRLNFPPASSTATARSSTATAWCRSRRPTGKSDQARWERAGRVRRSFLAGFLMTLGRTTYPIQCFGRQKRADNAGQHYPVLIFSGPKSTFKKIPVKLKGVPEKARVVNAINGSASVTPKIGRRQRRPRRTGDIKIHHHADAENLKGPKSPPRPFKNKDATNCLDKCFHSLV